MVTTRWRARRVIEVIALAALVVAGLVPAAEAVSLTFVVDDAMLVQALCQSRGREGVPPAQRAALRAAKDRAWELSQEAYNRLHDAEAPYLCSPEVLKALPDETRRFVDAVRRTPEFALVRAQTYERGRACEAQWKADRPRAEAFIRHLTGITSRDAYQVYLLHPAQSGGANFGKHRIIWGGREEWPHYTTVYMWHEILHDHLPHNELGHVLVQLAADRELRCYLNPQADREAYVGHDELESLNRAILPAWNHYLRQPQGSINVLYDELLRLHPTGGP